MTTTTLNAVAIDVVGQYGLAGKHLVQAYRLGTQRVIDQINERYSSLEAQSRLKTAREAGLRRKRVAKVDIDATAAGIILERWFSDKT